MRVVRITIDVSPAVHRHAGLGRYSHELLAALTALDHNNDYSAFYYATGRDERLDPPIDRIPAKKIWLPAKPWRLSVLLAYFLRASMDSWIPPSDIFHATDHLLPPLKCATVFTIHDLIFRFFPEYHLPLNRWYLSLMLPRFMRRADAIIAVSENTKRDATRLLDISPDKIAVIHEGVNQSYRPITDPRQLGAVRAKYLLPQHFILYLGTIEPRKNLPTLVEAYRLLLDRDRMTPTLVIAGRKGWLYRPVFDRVRDLGLDTQVLFTDYIESSDLPALMSAAELFVFPSLYEGFGLPPLEAMACGTPVICSNTSSMPEVVGDGGLLFNPRDVSACADAMERVLKDDNLRAGLRARGLSQAARFTWERTARETLKVYERVRREAGVRGKRKG